MKSINLKILISLGLLVLSVNFESRGQGASLDGFSLKISPGALTYYGDLSTNNINLPKRILTGSKFGVGVGIIKQFSPFFGMQAQFVAGSLYTSAADDTYFTGSLTEFSLSARIDPLKLIKQKSFKLSPYASVGIATFGFRSVRRAMGTNLVLLPNFGYDVDGLTKTNKQTAMSMPIAIGISYQVLTNLRLELEHSHRLTNTDLLDSFKGPGKSNDLYSLTSIGLRFTIPVKANIDPEPDKALNTIPLTEKTLTSEVNIFIECDMPETLKNGQVFDVKVRVNKGSYKGSGKLTQKYPVGFTAVDGTSKGNLFSFNNQTVTIDWEKMPNDSSVTYNYKVKVSEKTAGSQSIIGKFDYQWEGNQTVRFNKSVFIENTNQASEKDFSISENNESTNNTKVTKGDIRPSQPKAGIEFRVQCGAFRDNRSADKHLAVKYNIAEIIQEEFTDGWYKYTVGSFKTYEEAARYRDTFITRTGILSSFIVAYQDGNRLLHITDAYK